jgi:hypothetical protein
MNVERLSFPSRMMGSSNVSSPFVAEGLDGPKGDRDDGPWRPAPFFSGATEFSKRHASRIRAIDCAETP